jgi:type IV pilus assembly protein PilN
MRVRLNIATKPLEMHRRFLAGSGLGAAVAGIVFLSLGWHVYAVRKADSQFRARSLAMREEMARLQTQRKELEQFFAQKDIAALHDRAASINSILDSRSFNWTQMFMDLEHILPNGVRVVSIEPKQVSGRVEVKLTIGATNDEARLNFLHALEESKQFTDIQVTGVHVAPAGQTGDPQSMQMTALYYSRI